MASIDSLMDRVRLELADTPKYFHETIRTIEDQVVYDLSVSPVRASSVSMVHEKTGGVVTEYVVEEHTGRIIFDAPPAPGEDYVLTGINYRFFTDAELVKICSDSFEMHSGNRTDSSGYQLTLTRLGSNEEYPLTLLCTLNALYILATDASFDIDIYAPDGVNIPRSERYRQLMQMIEEYRGRYKELCSLLGIGLYAIDIFSLRRISKRTNRYVPVYRPQEVDDRTAPRRVRLAIPTYGGDVGDPIEANYDFHLDQITTFDRSVTYEVDGIPYDLTGYTATMKIKRYKMDPGSILELNTEPGGGLTIRGGEIDILITRQQLKKLPRRSLDYIYEIRATAPDPEATVLRVLSGLFIIENEVPVR